MYQSKCYEFQFGPDINLTYDDKLTKINVMISILEMLTIRPILMSITKLLDNYNQINVLATKLQCIILFTNKEGGVMMDQYGPF